MVCTLSATALAWRLALAVLFSAPPGVVARNRQDGRCIGSFGGHLVNVIAAKGAVESVSIICGRHLDGAASRKPGATLRTMIACRKNLSLSKCGGDLDEAIARLKRWLVWGYLRFECDCAEMQPDFDEAVPGPMGDRHCIARQKHMAVQPSSAECSTNLTTDRLSRLPAGVFSDEELASIWRPDA